MFTAAKMGIDFLGAIPLHSSIRETSDAGTPITVVEPNGPHSRAFKEIAQKVITKIESEEMQKKYQGPTIEVV